MYPGSNYDKYGWHGSIRGFTFAAGPGAFRDGNFDELIEKKPWDDAWVAANTPKEPEVEVEPVPEVEVEPVPEVETPIVDPIPEPETPVVDPVS